MPTSMSRSSACRSRIHGMDVKSGDLIHADRHGAVVVPVAKVDALQAALDGLIKQEARIIAAARKPGVTVEEHQGGIPGLIFALGCQRGR